MKTLYQTNYRGFVIRIRRTSYQKDGYYPNNNFIAEAWIYKPEIDMEELDGGYYGFNMMQSLQRMKGLIDTMLSNGRKI